MRNDVRYASKIAPNEEEATSRTVRYALHFGDVMVLKKTQGGMDRVKKKSQEPQVLRN
jgi:hypothetical protein